MMSARDAALSVLKEPREKRLRALDAVLGRAPVAEPRSPLGMAKLARNAELVTILRVECGRRREPEPWHDVRSKHWSR